MLKKIKKNVERDSDFFFIIQNFLRKFKFFFSNFTLIFSVLFW